MPIKTIKARQIFDSRGNPTVEVDLTTDKGESNQDKTGRYDHHYDYDYDHDYDLFSYIKLM